MENKYKKGDVVAERIRPALKLVIRGYMDRIYYCKDQEGLAGKELVYFEHELKAYTNITR